MLRSRTVVMLESSFDGASSAQGPGGETRLRRRLKNAFQNFNYTFMFYPPGGNCFSPPFYSPSKIF